MTVIDQDIFELPRLSSAQPSLSFALTQPIKLQGEVHENAFIQDIAKYFLENTNKKQSYCIEIGVDEVGRGPLYGSVVIAAAILPRTWSGEIENALLTDTALAILTDSKKLTEKKRERLYLPIKEQVLAYLIVEVPAATIDDINILQATMLGMRLACEQLMIQVSQSILSSQQQMAVSEPLSSIKFKLLFDGNKIPDLDWQQLESQQIGGKEGFNVESEAWIKGDGRHTAIAAASVLAKVTRDKQVIEDGLANPGYGLEKHKGYPTKAHIEAIQKLGVLPQHRRSFRPVQDALSLQS